MAKTPIILADNFVVDSKTEKRSTLINGDSYKRNKDHVDWR